MALTAEGNQLIDFEEAKALPQVRLWLQVFGERWNAPARIVEEVVGHDWGWQLACAPSDPPAGGTDPEEVPAGGPRDGPRPPRRQRGPNAALFHLLASRPDVKPVDGT